MRLAFMTYFVPRHCWAKRPAARSTTGRHQPQPEARYLVRRELRSLTYTILWIGATVVPASAPEHRRVSRWFSPKSTSK
jgi:hypothetical protein